MLQHVDTMIGFATVMLLLSLLITVMVQGVVAVINLRGYNLVLGLAGLLERLGAGGGAATALAKKVLSHPSVASSWRRLPELFRYAVAIRAEEIVRVLRVVDKELGASDPLRSDLKTVLAGLDDAGTELWTSVVEGELDDLRKAFPDEVARAAPLLEKLKTRVLRDANDFKSWYDTLMDRASERFARHTHLATLFFAALLAFGLSIDALYVFQRISSDAELRARLVQSTEATLALAGAQRLGEGAALTPARLDALEVSAKAIKEKLDAEEFPLWPKEHLFPWRKGYSDHVLGMFMTMLMLSLGAPFWYTLLRQLANLRPLLARKVDLSNSARDVIR